MIGPFIVGDPFINLPMHDKDKSRFNGTTQKRPFALLTLCEWNPPGYLKD